MRHHVLRRQTRLDRPPDEVFPFFADALNLERITPPWLGFRVLTPAPVEMREGARISYRLRVRGVPLRWVTEIAAWEPPHRFVDVQLNGPYRLWHHTHEFAPDGDGTLMTDVVRYALPLGVLGAAAHLAFVRHDVRRIFDHRESTIRADPVALRGRGA